MKTHIIKSRGANYSAIAFAGARSTNRINDRGYEVGDQLIIMEYEPGTENFCTPDPGYTGRIACARITHTSSYGLQPGYLTLHFEIHTVFPLPGNRP